MSVYALGFSGNEGTYWAGPPAIPNDPITVTTLLRWGNYDAAHAAVQWNTSEVPSALSAQV